MYVYDFYLIYDKNIFENLLEYGDILLDNATSIVGEPILSIEREEKMSDAELKELKNTLQMIIEKQINIGRNYTIVYEVWEV